MKKFVSVLLASTMVLSLAGCSTPKATAPTPPVAGTESKEENVKLTAIVAGLTEESPSGIALKKFAELCNEYSAGSVEIDCFFNTELGSVSSCVDSMVQGTIDICSTGTSYFSGYVPEIQVFELPYIFNSYEEVRATLDNEPGEKVAAMFDGTGMKMLCYWESGMRHVTNSRNAVNTPEDMKGLKIRTVVSETQQATWKAFGAIPMALDMGEVFTALQNGTVDAQENTLSSITSYKMYEVQDYLSMTYHSYTPMPFYINQNKWDSLTENQQQAVQKASEEARDYARTLNSESEAENMKILKDNGINVNENPDREAFAALCEPVYKIFNDQMGTEEHLKMVQDYVAGLK